MSDIEFPDGIWFKEPAPNAPDFIIGKISIAIPELMSFLQSRQTDEVKLDIKRSKKGKVYLSVDTWKPGQDHAKPKTFQNSTEGFPGENDFNSDEIPF